MPEPARQFLMMDDDPAPLRWTIPLPDEAATRALGQMLADEVRPGDLVGLSGDLGSGKTTLARAIIHALSGDPDLEVPSPTFTLVQSYETPRGPVLHADLYRIGSAEELLEIGLDEVADASVVLIEWPERAAAALAPDRLTVTLVLAPAAGHVGRSATLTASGSFAPRLARLKALRELLARSGWDGARRILLQGDASTRAYERLEKPSGETAILMISPPRSDGPPVRRGKPYSAIAKLAETVHAFVAVDRGLRALGFSAPKIYGEELDAGLLVLEDLGSELVVNANGPIPERYGEATRVLAKLHASSLPEALPVAEGGRDHTIPAYDLDAFLIEAELLLDWYLPHAGRPLLSGSARAEFVNLWSGLLEPLISAPRTWTLRDYHSPNLIWLPDRDGLKRVGLLDFQDAVLGPAAYDVASLLQDARVTVPPELELRLLGLYARERKAADRSFDMGEFAGSYAILAAQRATKILGIFARLNKRDRKPQYLAHLPRIEAYLARNLTHPALAGLKWWYETHVPRFAPTD